MSTCLITLDLINGICHKDGALARYADRIAHKEIIEKVNQLCMHQRQQPGLLVHVRVGFRTLYPDGSNVSPLFKPAKENQLLQLDSWDCAFCDDLKREESDVEVVKHRVSAFYGTDLDLILRANRIEHLVLCGVATNNAVELTAREAHDRDFKVTVIDDACETANDAEHNASIHMLKKLSTVVSSQDYLK